MSRIHALLIAGLLFVPSVGWPRAGMLDPSFGAGGITVATAPGDERAYFGLELEPDGRVVVAGRVQTPPAPAGPFLARYLPDGSLDPTFGTGGTVLTPVVSGEFTGHPVRQPDGSLLVAGNTTDPAPPYERHAIVVRYDSSGTLDPLFGVGGVATLETDSATGAFETVIGLALQPDGKIVLAGANDEKPAFVRLEANGSLDPSFAGGIVTFSALPTESYLAAPTIQADGKLIAVGNVAGKQDVLLARVDANGSPDGSFGLGGVVITNLGGAYDEAEAVAEQPDGMLVIAGVSGTLANPNLAVARYDGSGTLDPSFGTGGVVVKDLTPVGDYGDDLVLQPDGKIVVVGSTAEGYPLASLLLARFQADGTLDASFGTGGTTVLDPTPGLDVVSAVVRQPDGKLVAAGIRDTHDAFVARFDGNTCSSTPQTGCKLPTAPRHATLLVKHGASAAKDQLVWKWTRGAATTLAELGTPTTTTGWALCAYQGTALAYEATEPAGGTCHGRPCWKTLGSSGVKYADRDADPDGVSAAVLKAGTAGKALAQVKAKGIRVGPPATPLTLPLRVQLQGDNGTCLESTFSSTGAIVNTGLQFKGKAD